MRTAISVALALVGLLAGAGFATGREVTQYFVSYGSTGVFIGTAIGGIILVSGCLLIFQIGSYFMADEHSAVFRNVAHPRISWFFDASVTLTLFALGLIMLAGGGATLNQQFGLAPWLGSLILAFIVFFSGLMDVDKVSKVIGAMTPLMIIVVIAAFIYTMLNLPDASIGELDELATTTLDPILSPWWWSAINHAGMSLLCAVGMSLVIGGNYSSMRQVAVGGALGGITVVALIVLMSVTIYLNVESAGGAEIPMTAVVQNIHPAAGLVVSFIVLSMIYNTALADFYALSRRISVGHESKRMWAYAGVIAVGYALSLFGFSDLLDFIFPIIGVIGCLLFIMFLAWRIRWSTLLKGENDRRERIRDYTRIYLSPNQRTTAKDRDEVLRAASESVVDDRDLVTAIFTEEEELIDETQPDGPIPDNADEWDSQWESRSDEDSPNGGGSTKI